jgi:POT family proton-dependent oligopeptide transporter
MFSQHPRGLFICFATEVWERFSYYGMRALLIFYLMQHFLFSEQESFVIYGAYTALVYMTSVLGGAIADRYLGARKAVTLGAVLLVMGHFGMAFEGSVQIFYLCLALIIVGVGFLKPNASTLVGALYRPDDSRRDAGFTIFYMGINIGGAAAPLLCGWLGQTYGWHYGFGLAGLGMLAGLLVFLRGQRLLLGHAEPPSAAWLRQPTVAGLSRETVIYIATIGFVLLVWLIMNRRGIVGPMLAAFGTITGAAILYYAFARCTPQERDRLLVCATLLVFTIAFWALYEQLGSSLNVFADRMVDRRVLGYQIPTPMFQGLPSIFVILGAPLASSLWLYLGRRNREPSAAVKFTLAIVQVGLAFLALSLGLNLTEAGEKIALGWFVLNFFLLTCGELCLAPVGMSMVTKLSPKRIVGVMMGAFFLAYSASNFIAGQIARLTAQSISSQSATGNASAMESYAHVYTTLGCVALAAALLLWLLAPLLTRRMHEAASIRQIERPAQLADSKVS